MNDELMQADWDDDIDSNSEITAASSQQWTHSVASSEIGQRLDVLVTTLLPNGSRAEAQRLIEMRDAGGGVNVNGQTAKANYRVRGGDTLTIERPPAHSARALPEAIPLAIVYEDADLLVIDKPRGMVVHPAPGAETGTLVNAVLAHASDLSGIGGETRPGIVHRLDKDTGGLLMVAKNDFAHRQLQAQIQGRTASRRYQALVWGVPNFQQAVVEAPIGRHPGDRKKMAVVTDARHTARSAQTELTVRAVFAGLLTLLEARLQTGRTHQIRVHCAYIHHPIVGDPLYGGLRKLPSGRFPATRQTAIQEAIDALDGQALHAFALAFDHPRTGERLEFTVPLPPPMQRLLDLLTTPAAPP